MLSLNPRCQPIIFRKSLFIILILLLAIITLLSFSQEHKPNPCSTPVLIFTALDDSIVKSIEYVTKYNPSRLMHPVIISVDGDNQVLSRALDHVRDNVDHIWRGFSSTSTNGYARISEHYFWALNKIFESYESVIILEDDLIISCDFFDYFNRISEILSLDPTIWCISAWNDNGNPNLISKKSDEVKRTDFMPGLGWMLTKEIWNEIKANWPEMYWDDYMRSQNVRKSRQCLYPEVSRTKHMSVARTSKGQFMGKYSLNAINENCSFSWENVDITGLYQENYEERFYSEMKEAVPVNLDYFKLNLPLAKKIVIKYTNDTFSSVAEYFGLMDGEMSGVYRCSYKGVLSFYYKNVSVYLSPH